ncbi:alkaline shock response membrane anchor protein AmaP [Actinokineospora sp. PR83]|uniref:alkaline shock response membrane anchor protein AmaP n=1 Tax=Actinokineospora sp. PR83 TaxID=2884908 RepID=UPI001F27B9F1|nr:alkaline shock response membrane anchor protein AmaP [Actinokineospora sp. PR83]MCG8918172.1 alkaline shock response membrane anchor protein AmaP [Actinokineospora sp. PR83]
MKSPSVAALARSYRAERVVTALIGLLALLAGATALVVGQGWLGSFRAVRPVLDPIALDTLGNWQTHARVGAVVAGVLLLVLGLLLAARTLRPERHPDLALDRSVGSGLVVTASAIAEAIAVDAEQVDGVSRARATVVGDPEEPALRLSVWLHEGTRLKDVWRELDGSVLTRARDSLGVDSLPTAVRVELGTAERQRVR